MISLALMVLVIWCYLMFLHAGFWRVRPVVLPAATRKVDARVVAVIPARDEEALIGQAVASLLKQEYAGTLHVIVVDDHSSDTTAEVARHAADQCCAAKRLTVIPAAPLPAGWNGKVWAMQQGTEAALALSPEYLLSTDADIVHAPGAVQSLVDHAAACEYDLTSVMVKLHCESASERLLIPAFVYFFFLLYPPRWIADRRQSAAGAAGGCMLVKPAALVAAGGFESIRGEIIDDCALARAVKRSGGSLWLGLSDAMRSVRLYGGWAGIRQMVSRTAFNQLRHSWWLLAGCIAGMLLTFVLPVALLSSGSMDATVLAALALALMFATYAPMVRWYRLPIWYAVTLPFAAMFYMYATCISAIEYARGEGGAWKSRAQDVRGI